MTIMMIKMMVMVVTIAVIILCAAIHLIYLSTLLPPQSSVRYLTCECVFELQASPICLSVITWQAQNILFYPSIMVQAVLRM